MSGKRSATRCATFACSSSLARLRPPIGPTFIHRLEALCDEGRKHSMSGSKLRVGVLGAGAWAQHAHIPGWQRDPRCEIVAICDLQAELARDFAHQFGIAETTSDWQALVARDDIDVID